MIHLFIINSLELFGLTGFLYWVFLLCFIRHDTNTTITMTPAMSTMPTAPTKPPTPLMTCRELELDTRLSVVWEMGSVVNASVVVKGGSVGGKPPKSGILRLMNMVTRKEKTYQLQCGLVELKQNSL